MYRNSNDGNSSDENEIDNKLNFILNQISLFQTEVQQMVKKKREKKKTHKEDFQKVKNCAFNEDRSIGNQSTMKATPMSCMKKKNTFLQNCQNQFDVVKDEKQILNKKVSN